MTAVILVDAADDLIDVSYLFLIIEALLFPDLGLLEVADVVIHIKVFGLLKFNFVINLRHSVDHKVIYLFVHQLVYLFICLLKPHQVGAMYADNLHTRVSIIGCTIVPLLAR